MTSYDSETVARAKPLAASLHGIDMSPDGRTLQLTGTCRRDGTDGETPPDDVVRLVVVDSDGNTQTEVDTQPRLRFEDGARRWTGFEVDLPVDSIPVGSSFLSLHLPSASVDLPLAPAIGLLASSRPLVTDRRRVQAVAARGANRVELISRRGGSVRWESAMLRRDFRDLIRRRPFAWARIARIATRPFVPRSPIWLIGERSDTARDNGYHLYAYLCRERPDIRAYYVIDPKSDQRSKVAPLGRVIAHSSRKHRRLMLHASVLANAYSLKHMVPKQWSPNAYLRHLAWRIGSHRVYLKHGIHVNTTELRRRSTGYDLYLTSTPAETIASRETSGYDRQIVETGLPRYDALTPTPRSRTILFMPTWRLYLIPKLFSGKAEGDIPFEGSAYRQFVVDLLTSPRLLALLEQHDHRLQLMPHYNLRDHLAGVQVSSARVEVLDGAGGDIQEVLRECDLFVTDHSSTQFDVAYLGTPVIYAHFDEEDYQRGHAKPSWFDDEQNGFGPVVTDLEATIDAIEHYLDTDCQREETYDGRARASFVHRDQDNSRRAVTAIESLLRPPTD